MKPIHLFLRKVKEIFRVVLRGFLMGAADVVPGVSGGTMAFITGIYEELIFSIRSIDLDVIKSLLTFKFKVVFKKVPWQFLLSLLAGILFAILTLSRTLAWLLEHRAVYLWAFFFGLVVASVFTVTRKISVWRKKTLVAIGVAMVSTYLIVGIVPVETPSATWFIFLSGAVSICAMILPGISGSFILVLLGKYQYILNAVNEGDYLTLCIFAAGAGVGIISFSQILGWIFKRYHDLAIALLTGLMIGSLRKIWPWKEMVSAVNTRSGKENFLEEVNVFPSNFTSEVAFGLGLLILGFSLVVILDWMARNRTTILTKED